MSAAAPNYRGVVFDLDGVLCHTDSFHFASWKKIADSLGVVFTEKDNDLLRGVSRMDSLEIILRGYHGKPLSQNEKEALAAEKNGYYVAMLQRMSPTDVDAEVLAALDGLRDGGISLAVGSSSKNARLILEKTGLEGYFGAVADGNCISRSKPDPEVFLKAAGMLGLEPRACLVVEDATAGVDAAADGGFGCAAMGAAAGYGRADYSIGGLSELAGIVFG